MPPVRVEPLAEDHRAECAALLADRHARHREREPLLPVCDDFSAQLQDEPGCVALRGPEVVAYVAGTVADDGRDGGPVATIGFAGAAASDAEALRTAYAALAAEWAEQGCRRHAVAVPAGDELLLDAFFRLAFGRQLTWGVREVPSTACAQSPQAGVTVRPSTPADLDDVARLDAAFWDVSRASPSFSGMPPRTRDDLRAEWSDTWDDGAPFTLAVAELDGRVVGHLLLYRRPEGDLRVPPRSVDLAHAVTAPDVRGRGAGLALTDWAFAWARDHGCEAITVDWRDPNLHASRFWPRRGFRPQFHRLYRALP